MKEVNGVLVVVAHSEKQFPSLSKRLRTRSLPKP